MNRVYLTALVISLLFAGQSLYAVTVTFSPVDSRPVTTEEVNDFGSGNGPDPADVVYSFRVTTNADILRVGDVFIDFPLYRHPEGPPGACLVCFPGTSSGQHVDSYITTPGNNTAMAGGDLGDDNVSWLDTSDDGPATDFLFAQLTTRGSGVFRGVISVAGSAGPEIFPFSFPVGIPEPRAHLLAGVGVIGVVLSRRRGQGHFGVGERTGLSRRFP